MTSTLSNGPEEVKFLKIVKASWGVRDFEILVERCPSECELCTADNL